MSLISIVVPVFNEAKNIERFVGRVQEAVKEVSQHQFEIIFINDGSLDKTMEVIRKVALDRASIKAIDLSRNFGKEIALSAGVHAAKGDAVITIDADLQHPPELIPTLIESWEKGIDIVATIRTHSEKQPLLRKFGSWLFYWLMGKISSINMVSKTTDYRLVDRKIVDVFNSMPERSRIYRGMIDWVGFSKIYVEFKASEREEGVAGYTMAKLVGLAVNSLTSFSVFPLKIASFVGGLMMSLSALMLALLVPSYFFSFKIFVFSPMVIVMLANTFMIGVVLLCLGIIALYIGSIHEEVIRRPLYIVKDQVNLRAEEVDRPNIINEEIKLDTISESKKQVS